MREVQKKPLCIQKPSLSHSLICRNRAGHPNTRPPPFSGASLGFLGNGSSVPGLLKVPPLFQRCLQMPLLRRVPATPPLPLPAAKAKTPESWLPTFKACKTQLERSEEQTLRGSAVPSLLRLQPNFALSFSSRRFKGKAEVRAARRGSCTTDLYTRGSQLCCV